MSSVNWGLVKEHQCPSCSRWMVAFTKNKISEHNDKGKKCDGVGQKPSRVRTFDGDTYDEAK